jgi:hypothetical protein
VETPLLDAEQVVAPAVGLCLHDLRRGHLREVGLGELGRLALPAALDALIDVSRRGGCSGDERLQGGRVSGELLGGGALQPGGELRGEPVLESDGLPLGREGASLCGCGLVGELLRSDFCDSRISS